MALIAVVLAQDATHLNHAAIPPGMLAAGYDTGSPDIMWTTADYAAHALPHPAIHIDQDAGASDPFADVLDVESGAANVSQIAGWVTRARAAFRAISGRRSQRWPMVYCGMGTLDGAVQALQAAGIANVPFWTAEPGTSLTYATGRIQGALGPYPCRGVQYAWGGNVDFDAFSLDWVTATAGAVMTTPQENWHFCERCAVLFWPWAANNVCPGNNGGHHVAGPWAFTLPTAT